MKSKLFFMVTISVIIVIIISCQTETEPQYYKYDWEKQQSSTLQNLNDITFSDSLTGWICGNKGILLRTTDRGENWDSEFFPSEMNLKKIKFIDSDKGFILGENIVFKTTDRGNTWKSIFTKTEDSDIDDMQFIDEDNGWICSWHIYATKDGGLTWNIISPQIDTLLQVFLSVYFINNNYGYAAGYAIDTSNFIWKDIVIKTDDGGKNWQIIKEGKDLNVKRFKQMMFLTPELGFLVSEWNEIYKTTDGGNKWYQPNENIQSTYHDNGYYIGHQSKLILIDSLNLVLTGNDRTYTDKYVGYISRSSDGGNYWQPYQTGFYGKINSGYYKTTKTGWLVGDGGIILKTTNSGVYYYN
ncbi:MAG: hypothetical protein EPN82_12960 [Bacteroidetes bacterium]|nr:MAG: hypothetical protein EPN82_12960 [Bacteroidota bacterium]